MATTALLLLTCGFALYATTPMPRWTHLSSTTGDWPATTIYSWEGDEHEGLLLEGNMDIGSCRPIDVVVGGTVEQHSPLVAAERVDDYWGEPAIRIKARNATYYYHLGGSGFAS